MEDEKKEKDVIFTPHGIKDEDGEMLDIEFELEEDEDGTDTETQEEK